MAELLDSGARREFETGAVRDIQEGKGRCDLLPLGVVARLLDAEELHYIYQYQITGDLDCLVRVLKVFSDRVDKSVPTLMREVSIHYEDGTRKYSERNWEKGIPTKNYIDSGVRHFLKILDGMDDEPHDRAFVWNILGCMWTSETYPELNDYPLNKSE